MWSPLEEFTGGFEVQCRRQMAICNSIQTTHTAYLFFIKNALNPFQQEKTLPGDSIHNIFSCQLKRPISFFNDSGLFVQFRSCFSTHTDKGRDSTT